jgi:magnesium transporter
VIGLAIGIIVLLTMMTMLVLTNLVGVVPPFILTRIGLDPAIASGPLITSAADAVGLIICFSFAV